MVVPFLRALGKILRRLRLVIFPRGRGGGGYGMRRGRNACRQFTFPQVYV
jgi:hypothetical protein